MDPIDILGSILGQKSSGGGKGADILKEIFKGMTQKRPAPAGQSPATRTPGSGATLDQQAKELEDLLNVAKNRGAQRPTSSPTQPSPTQQTSARPDPTKSDPTKQASRTPGQPQAAPAGSRSRAPWETSELPTSPAERQNVQAMVLVRAMVNAAKSDGQISQAEQQGILDRLDNPSQETIQFLREEFARPLDVRDFAWSVPVGMEQQVYSMSLIAIDVNTREESEYLQQLARGLRLTPEACSQIEQQMGVAQVAAR